MRKKAEPFELNLLFINISIDDPNVDILIMQLRSAHKWTRVFNHIFLECILFKYILLIPFQEGASA